MKSEDLFAAIGAIESSRLAQTEPEQSSRNRNGEELEMKHPNSRKLIRNCMIAAAVIAVLSATAYAVNARIALEVTKYPSDSIATETSTGSYDVEIDFQKTTNEYLELGSVYPQKLPEGYTIRFVSDNALGVQHIVYADDTGEDALRFIAQIGSEGNQMEFMEVTKEEALTVQGLPGTLYQYGHGSQALVWQNEEQGVGYILVTEKPNPGLDLPAIAESVDIGQALTPTLSSGYDKALDELGDYRITALPNGFRETDFMASPLEQGGGWYAYVRRWYGDKVTTDSTIYFEYEHFSLASEEPEDHPEEPVENSPETVLRMYGGGEPVTVQQMPGALTDGSIVWVDWDAQVCFRILASGRQQQELTALAESVQRFN